MPDSMLGADGFEWETSIGEGDNPLAGNALEEWWREVDGKPGNWWRISREPDDMGRNEQYFLRLWKTVEERRILNKSGFSPEPTLARAQEKARDQENRFLQSLIDDE